MLLFLRQVPDEEKRRRADFVINTGCSLQESEQQVRSVLEQLRGRQQGTAAARLLAEGQTSQPQ